MPSTSPSGTTYRRMLPHIREPGRIYHVRFSLQSDFGRLTENRMFEIVERSILFGHKKTNLLHAYVIMPNHTHIVIEPLPKIDELSAWSDYRQFYPLESIMGRLKGYSAWAINRQLGRSGPIWRSEFFDRIIRSGRDLEVTIDYIHHNPVRWNMVQQPQDYRWSSAFTIYSGNERYRGWFELGRP